MRNPECGVRSAKRGIPNSALRIPLRTPNSGPNPQSLRVLILEDVPQDADLIQRELRRAKVEFSAVVRETREELCRELDERPPELILSDYNLPSFTGLDALELVRSRCPSIPLIIVTGSLDEETAVECIKQGAADYVLKDHLAKLTPSVRRALREKQVAEQRDRAEGALRFTQFAVDSAGDAAFWTAPDGRFLYVNQEACRSLGYSQFELLAMSVPDIDPNFPAAAWPAHWQELQQRKTIVFESTHRARDGREIPVEVSVSHQEFEGQEYNFRFARDITQRKDAEARIRVLNRLLRTRSEIDQLIVREQEREPLLDAACRIFVEHGRLVASWIGLSTAGDGNIAIAAACGVDRAVLSHADLSCDAAVSMPYPACAAVRERRVVTVRDIAAERDPTGWPEVARQLGVAAVVSVPLVSEDAALGALTVWSADESVLDHDSVTLLADVAADLAFALRGIEERAARRRAQDRLKVNAAMLQRANAAHDLDETVRTVVETVQEHLGIEAVGVRLQADDDFPYYQTSGFPARFVKAESSLCARDASGSVIRDAGGNPVLECMCGNVICGRTDPALPFFTNRGSFWTNSTSELLASTTEEDRQAWTRNRCNGEGYESVALIPLRSGQSTIGLLQLNDHRKGRFSSQLVEWLEEIGDTIGVAVARSLAEDGLRRSEDATGACSNAASRASIGRPSTGGFSTATTPLRRSSATPRARRCSNVPRASSTSTARSASRSSQHCRLLGGFAATSVGCADGTAARHGSWRTPLLIADDSGGAAIIEGTLVDVTERKRAEQRLLEREAFLNTLLDAIPIPVFYKGRDGVYLGCNRAYEEFFGVPGEQLIGRTAFNLNPPELGAVYHAKDQELLDTGGTQEYESQVRDTRGASHDVIFNKAVFQDQTGAVSGLIGTILDITDLRSAEAQLLQSQKMEAIGRLAGGVAHDFNNQLQVITMYCDLAQSRLRAGDPLSNDVKQIKTAAERSANLTRQLLAFSRRQALAPKVLDLNHTVGEMDKMLRRLVGEDVEVKRVLAPDLGLVKADISQLEQVIVNLVVNAREAMSPGGRLTVETANVELDERFAHTHGEVVPGRYVMMAVSDTGCGMDQETRLRVFEPFFTTKTQGTGLGLATVHGIVRQSGGHIFCYSEPGMGTAFKVYLPRTDEELAVETTAVDAPATTRGTETVLLAEDEESLRLSMKKVLEKEGYTVLAAANGGEALLLCRRHEGPIDLLISDIVMPGMSGKELADEVVALRPGVKALFMSGYTSNGIVHDGQLDEGTPFLQKPFNSAALAAKIRQVLGGP